MKHNGTQTIAIIIVVFCMLLILCTYLLAYLGHEPMENMGIALLGTIVSAWGIRVAKRVYDNRYEQNCPGEIEEPWEEVEEIRDEIKDSLDEEE